LLDIQFTLITLFLEGNFISTISGYIDPASGMLVLQMIAGVLIGFGIAIKIYWHKLKEKFSSIGRKRD